MGANQIGPTHLAAIDPTSILFIGSLRYLSPRCPQSALLRNLLVDERSPRRSPISRLVCVLYWETDEHKHKILMGLC